jgi:YD repeat-containing protein
VTSSIYDAANNLTSRQFGGSGQTPLRVDLAYTARNQIATMARYSDLAGTQTVGYAAYNYDNAARLTNIQHKTWTYGYDNLNHMVWAKDSATDGGTVTTLATYVYDAFGNRIERDVWTQSSGTRFDAAGRLQASIDPLLHRTTFAYDRAGHQGADHRSDRSQHCA